MTHKERFKEYIEWITDAVMPGGVVYEARRERRLTMRPFDPQLIAMFERHEAEMAAYLRSRLEKKD